MNACPLCRERRGKRACPAKQAGICAQCCGAKRRIEIDCPPDCVYLTGAHAGSWGGRETERRRDLRRVAPFVEPLSEPQAQLFFACLLGLQAVRARRRELDDRLLEDAVTALRKTVETRARGLIYEHPPEDARAIGLLAELQGLFEAQDADGTPLRPPDVDVQAVLGALGQSLAETRREAAGATTFLDTAARLAGQLAAERPAPAQRTPLVLLD